MHRPPSPVPDIGFDCTNEELFITLQKMLGGYPLPSNVITDVNPYNFPPLNLSERIWYLIRSKENGAMELGSWKVKGEACKLFSNSEFTGWRTTLEFFEGKVPLEQKTDWVMQKYWITLMGPSENSKMKENSSLCRVFLGGEEGLSNQKQHKMGSLHIANDALLHSTDSVAPMVNNGSSNESTSEQVVDKYDERGILAVTGEFPNHMVENPPENDFFSRGDYLELLDLDAPASPSSSSDNSSCLTMSSDEYFDSMALLRELDSESNQELVQKNGNCKFSISVTFRSNEVVMVPTSPAGSFTNNEESRPPAEEIPGTESSPPVDANKNLEVGTQKEDHRDEGPSNTYDVGSSSSSHHLPSRDGERRIGKGKKKKLKKKYMCFMPFYFFF